MLSGLLGILVGGFIGNKFALGRDKRREFNDISDFLFERLERQRVMAEKGIFSDDVNKLDQVSFIDLKRRILFCDFYNKKRLDIAVERYIQAKQNCGHFEKGQYVFSNPAALIEAILTLQKCLPHK